MKIYDLNKIAIEYNFLDIDSDDSCKVAEEAENVFRQSEIRPDSTKDIRDIVSDNGIVIGSTAWGWSKDDKEAVFSFDIAIKPEYRGQGISKKLIERAIQEFENSRYLYEELGLKTLMRLEAVNVEFGEYIVKKYGFRIEYKLSDRLILVKE